MATKRDWTFLRDVLRSLDKRVQAGEIVQGSPWDLPGELTGAMARDYLEQARRRFEEVETAVKNALASPIQRVQDAGSSVGSLVREGALRAAKIAKDVAQDMADSFEATVERMEEGGKKLAAGLGIGAGVAIVIALLLLRELKS
jgi:tetrahydromethanopterin S-methyltransferase subunit G